MKIPLVLMLLGLGGMRSSEASVIKSPITTELASVGQILRLYESERGRFPETWEEFDEFAPGYRQKLTSSNFMKRFVLLEEPVELPLRYKGPMRILVISREPFRRKSFGPLLPWVGRSWSLAEPAYTAIVLNKGGTFIERLTVEATRSAFRDAGVDMPEPSGLGLYPHEREYRIRQGVYSVTVLVLVLWIMVRLRRWWRDRSNVGKAPV